MEEFILAGNVKEYERWLTANKRSPKHRGFLSNAKQLDDVNDLKIHMIGTWSNRMDIASIMRAIVQIRARGKVMKV